MNRLKKYRLLFFLVILSGLLFIGCRPTKYVPSDKYLLNKVKVICNNKKIDPVELKNCARQKENRRVLGMRLYLGLYNLSNLNKTKGFNNQLRNMGEEPVIFDNGLTQISVTQIKSYMNSKGYLNAEVSDTVIFNKRKAEIIYHVNANRPYTYRSLKYSFEDTSIQRVFFKDTIYINSNLKIWNNGLFDIDLLNKERSNIEYYMRDNGYFRFSREMVSYDYDTSSNRVDLTMVIAKEIVKLPNGQLITIPHKQYRISRVTISTENEKFGKNSGKEFRKDTILKYGVNFVYQNNFWVRPSIIQQSNYILPGSLFRISDVEQTKSHLSSLNVFNVVNTNLFVEAGTSQLKELLGSDTAKYYYLNSTVKLTPTRIQSYDWGLVGTNSSGNFGGAVTLTYQHRSLFGNAENLGLKFRWALEALPSNSKIINKDLEYGADATLNIPKFLIPFNSMGFRKKYNPKTYLTLAYNYQNRPDFTRSMANVSFGYNWRGALYKTHVFTLIDLNAVDLWGKSAQFEALIRNTYLENLYTKHLVPSIGYTYNYNNQDFKKRSDYRYFNASFESAGFFLGAYNKLLMSSKAQSDSIGKYYTLFNLRYSQYVKAEFDFHYFHVQNEFMGTAYRLFFGIGVPYGNAQTLPFEKQFFAGGANSIRGWQVRKLGPGSYVDTISKYPNSTGDIKIEGNIEYRFKLFWIFEGALFADAGNIWLLPSKYGQKPSNAVFKFNDFYNQIAVGSGVGFRINVNYFLFRIDLGVKVRNPALEEGKRWIFTYREVTHEDLGLSFSIGYPF